MKYQTRSFNYETPDKTFCAAQYLRTVASLCIVHLLTTCHLGGPSIQILLKMRQIGRQHRVARSSSRLCCVVGYVRLEECVLEITIIIRANKNVGFFFFLENSVSLE